MGVKDLWTILSPVRQEKSLADLAGKTLAVDLSGWICQADTTKGLANSVLTPYLRNLFFRIYRLYSEGVSLVMVVDGEATQLKWSAMDQRKQEREKSLYGGRGACYHGNRRTGRRTQLDSKTKQCLQLLDALGIPHLQSIGEAEALCGLLNEEGLVDGVLTQDSDAFLYGATVVYRDISTNEKESHVSYYALDNIQSQLGLGRRDMVSLALLLGCDYCPLGVPHVGKEGAMKLIGTCKSYDKLCDMLDIMRGWRDGTRCENITKIETQVRNKALAVDDFPSEAVINEFLISKNKLPLQSDELLTWCFPNIISAQIVCHRLLDWPFEYTHNKVLSLITQWCLRKQGLTQDSGQQRCVTPLRIVKLRRRQGLPYYEVNWEARENLARLLTDETVSGATCSSYVNDDPIQFTTLEKTEQFTCAYPTLSTEFEKQKISSKQKCNSKERKASKQSSSDKCTDELSVAMSDLQLDTHRHHKTSGMIKVEPGSLLCIQSDCQSSKPATNDAYLICGDLECNDGEDTLSLSERMRNKQVAECVDIPPLARRLELKSRMYTDSQETANPTSAIDTQKSISREQIIIPETFPTSIKSCDKHLQFSKHPTHVEDGSEKRSILSNTYRSKEVIVISDSHSESETEDPLANMDNTLTTTPQSTTLLLHDKSSEDSLSSDDDIPPLFNRIALKTKETALSPTKEKVFPSKHVSSTAESRTTAKLIRQQGIEQTKSCKESSDCGMMIHSLLALDNVVIDDNAASIRSNEAVGNESVCDKYSNKTFSVPCKPGIGSADSPIVID